MGQRSASMKNISHLKKLSALNNKAGGGRQPLFKCRTTCIVT